MFAAKVQSLKSLLVTSIKLAYLCQLNTTFRFNSFHLSLIENRDSKFTYLLNACSCSSIILSQKNHFSKTFSLARQNSINHFLVLVCGILFGNEHYRALISQSYCIFRCGIRQNLNRKKNKTYVVSIRCSRKR